MYPLTRTKMGGESLFVFTENFDILTRKETEGNIDDKNIDNERLPVLRGAWIRSAAFGRIGNVLQLPRNRKRWRRG
ncbi:hypothetical protein I656_03887 [Geobacillus sp. WSUCF1]|nr:hypothetical protein I656_03887 [Geobacillus sp. WSUCF1]